jgi:outer membrane lipoprotein SlyB
MNRRLFLATALLAGTTALTAAAQTAPPTRVRGTIAAIEGNTLTVNSRDGQKLEIMLNDPLTVATVKKVELSSIAPGTFVGIASRPGADGKLTALEVLVFPEAMRGTGEGHYGWDLEPGSMMTNGTVKGAVTATSGHELTIGYKDSSNIITVPATTPVMSASVRTSCLHGASPCLGWSQPGNRR